jgi:site-specific DNA recombinase
VVHTLDRWARNVGVQRQALQQLGEANVGFTSVTEQIDFTTPAGRLMLTMMGGVSEFFSDQLAVHVSKSQRERALSGLPIGPVPFGYCARESGAAATVEPREAEAVTEVFRRRASGTSNGQLALWLNAQGLTTRRDLMFTAYAVRDLLKTRFYVGVVTCRGEEFRGQHEAIVSEELYQRAQRSSHRRQPVRKPGTQGVLAGMVSCGHCGRPLHSDRYISGQPAYRERHGHRCRTKGRSVAARYIDRQIADVFGSIELPLAWRERMAELAVGDSGTDVNELHMHRRRVARAYGDGAYADAEYEARLAEIDARIRSAVDVPASTVEEAADLLADLPSVWDEATPTERRKLIAPLVSERTSRSTRS